MINVSVFSDNKYTQLAIAQLIPTLDGVNRLEGHFTIFAFEKNWLDENEISSVMHCREGPVLILAKETLMNFLSNSRFSETCSFGEYQLSIIHLKRLLLSFINGSIKQNLGKENRFDNAMKLTATENYVTLLFIQGIPLAAIAVLMKKNVKTVSAHKRNAMKKVGVKTNAALVQKRNEFLFLHNTNWSD